MKPKPILLQHGRVIDPSNNFDAPADLLVVDGTCKMISDSERETIPKNAKRFDLSGKWVVPGFIDMHVHLREPGEEYKETIQSGTKSAAAGGFTAVACMPNTNPVNDCQAVTVFILDKAKYGAAKVYPVGSISKGSKGETLAEYGEMKKAGVVAVSDDGMPVSDSQLMRRALEYAGNHELLVISHAEDFSLSRGGVMNESGFSTRLGLRGIPRVAEEVMVYRDIALAEFTGIKVHIAHVSTRESVSLIRRAKEKGVQVSAETAPHYFTLTEEAVNQYNTRAKMNPPLRSADDVAAIIEGLADGTIDAIATDHAPHSILEKDLEFDLAANGIIGLETAIPLALELVRKNYIDVKRMVELFSCNPAAILGVEGGSLGDGACADITVIDPARKFTYTPENVISKSKNSPFLGWDLTGKAVMSIVDGRINYSDLL